eukprot:tig00020938_g16162.t1
MDGTAAADVADALHPHPCDIQPRNVGQFGTEFIYSLPSARRGRQHQDVRRPRHGAFKTIELTLTTLKTYGTDKPVADIYCRYYNEITFTNGGAYRRFH